VSAGGAVVDGAVSDEYRAAVEGLAVFDRSGRARWRVSGRAPRQMLNGILTGTLPAIPKDTSDGIRAGLASYHAVLTPKGKMISDAWVFLTGDEEGEGFLLDVPEAGGAPLREHLGKVLPPRFAKLDDVSDATGMIAVTGPEAAAALSRIAFGLRVEAETLSGLEEGGWLMAGSAPDGLVVMRVREIAPDAYWVLGDRAAVRALRDRLVEAGAVVAGAATWNTLRVEAGRPEFGVDMTEERIPIEAGIHDRVIDHQKGCYTGQEVIVRIRDRGHVNRNLRRLVLGDVPVPEAGTELFAPGDDTKSVGWITSAVRSPAEGGVVALAYVRRGVDPVVVEGREVAVG
jgi:tRNA-modifying protein YgfZ